MAIALALLAALAYGVADYVGGRASRRRPAVAVTAVAEVATLAGICVTLAVLADPFPTWGDLAWGAGAGLAGIVGILALYHGLAVGTMSVIAPITGVVAAGLPVVFGLLVGERPSVVALVGIGAAVLAVVLVSGAVGAPHEPTPARLVAVALLAGGAFGALFVFLERTSDDSGLWPLLGARVVAVPAIVALVMRRRALGAVRVSIGPGIAIGALTLSANVAYLLAVRRGLLSIVAVVVSLYPASTVLLATALDGERVRRSQAIGLGLAGAALAMVTLGR